MQSGMPFLHRIYSQRHREKLLLHDILKDVSRSFYLSLVIIPRSVRKQISLAYLFCRAADTIADTKLFQASQQVHILETFRKQFLVDSPVFSDIKQIELAVTPPGAGQRGEHRLFCHLADCFHLLTHFVPSDQRLIRELVLTLTQGMRMDLTHFSGESGATLRALPDFAALDLYTYFVAGIVGEFWTKMHKAHISAWQREGTQQLCALGIRYGKGLQMTNILKDLGKDLAIGRCYLPEAQLEQLHIGVDELLHPSTFQRIRPLILHLIWQTLDHLDQGCHYVLLLPRSALRSRLSCMWPLLFAIQTLEAIWKSENLLCPETPVKISRKTVYRTMALSLGCLLTTRIFTRYYAYLRRNLVMSLRSCQDYSLRNYPAY